MDIKIKILENKISIDEVKKLADFWYGTMIKGAVDIENGRVALGNRSRNIVNQEVTQTATQIIHKFIDLK
ncbi:hypothetical protein K8Q94_00830 [Candidatus Nomurabacteria bacterium]|nr:hypothetical protein [Candidatus Nomurabacteria bacterium]